MTDSKIGRPKKLLASGGAAKDVARTSACPFRRCTAGWVPASTHASE